ncbi:MAG: ureidoglycolate lyase [Acidimicrobiales bacterium]
MEPLIVPVELATPTSIAGVGELLGRVDGSVPVASRFLGNSVDLRKPVNFQSDDTTVLSLATVHRRNFELKWIERHHKHTQTFIPLGGRPFVLALAPPTNTDVPNLADIRAFLFDGSAGFTMRIGTWHEFPFALVDDTDVVVILRRETNQNLEDVSGNEASGEDLDKRDLLARAGRTVRIAL